MFKILTKLWLRWLNSIDLQIICQYRQNMADNGYDPFLTPERFEIIQAEYEQRIERLRRL